MDATGETNLHLQFWAKFKGLEAEDLARVFVSTDEDGEDTETLQTWSDADADDTYRFFDFDLDQLGVAPADDLWVGFSLEGDENNDRMFIDEVTILELPPVPAPPPLPFGPPITIDSDFSDWAGQAVVSDPSGDQSGKIKNDVHQLYWANNVDQEINFHMIKRHTTDGLPFDGTNGQKKAVKYILFVDVNNDGDYTDDADRLVEVRYHPKATEGKTRVKVRSPTSKRVISDLGNQDWGETVGEGGLRVEFAVDWDDLGFNFGGAIRFYAISFEGGRKSPKIKDRIPDGAGDIQWSPASIFGPLMLTILFGVGVAAIWWFRGRRVWR